MERAQSATAAYVAHAFTQLLAVAERLGDERVGVRPLGPRTNAVAGVVVHCCGMAEFWLGHVALGRPSSRDRAAEFSSAATVAQLRPLVARASDTALHDLECIHTGETVPGHEARDHLLAGGSDEALVLHVVEELFQHLGHAELAADALLGGAAGPA